MFFKQFFLDVGHQNNPPAHLPEQFSSRISTCSIPCRIRQAHHPIVKEDIPSTSSIQVIISIYLYACILQFLLLLIFYFDKLHFSPFAFIMLRFNPYLLDQFFFVLIGKFPPFLSVLFLSFFSDHSIGNRYLCCVRIGGLSHKELHAMMLKMVKKRR